MHYEQEDETSIEGDGTLMRHTSPEPPMVVDHDDPEAIAEVAAAYALDALSANEARQVTDHLPGCIKCRDEVARMRDTAGVLAYTVEPAPLPDGLRQRVLDRSRSLSTGPSAMDVISEQG